MSEHGDSDHYVRDVESVGAGLGAKELDTLRKARIARTAGLALAPEDLLGELGRLEPRVLNKIRGRLQVRSGAGLAAVVRSVRTKLATADERLASYVLLDCLTPSADMMSEFGELDEEELAALLAGRLDEVDLDPMTLLPDALPDPQEFGRTTPARTAVWSAIASTGGEGDVAALAWLVADPPQAFTVAQRAALTEAWEQVRARKSLLPEAPLTVAEVAALAVARHDEESTAAAVSERADNLERLGRSPARLVGEEPSSDLDLEGLQERGQQLEQRRMEVARGSATELSQSVAEGRIFGADALKDVIAFAGQLSTFFEAIADITGAQAPGTLDDAREQLDRAVTARADTARLDRARRLATLRAPAFLAEGAQRVIDLARSLDGETAPEVLAGLNALVTLIELGGSDPEQAVELGRAVSAAVPDAVSLLMFTASPDVLQIADAIPASDTAQHGEAVETNTEQEPEPGPDPAPESAPIPGSAAEGASVTAANEFPTVEDALAGLDLTLPVPTGGGTRRDDNPGAIPAAPAGAPPALIDAEPDDHDEAGDLYSAVMADRQYALAYWLATTGDSADSIRAAYELATYAAAIKTSTGPNAAAFAATVGRLDPDELRDHLGTQMVVYAAAVRAGLLSPTAGAAGPLRDVVTSIVRSGDAVAELTELLLNGIYGGLHLTPRSADAVLEAAEADNELDRLARDAATLLSTASSRTLVYQGATELLLEWVAPNGPLGAPLSLVADRADDDASLTFVRERVAMLRDRHQLDALIDRGRRRHRRAKRIESRARERLVDWAASVADLLSQWVIVNEDLQQPGHGTWMDDPMADLRNKVAAVRDLALAELADVSGGDVLYRAAALEAGRAMLTDALDLLAGKMPPAGPELPADRVLGGPLVLAAQLPLHFDLTPRRPVTVDDIVAAHDALHAGADGWQAAFEARSARHDHVGTELLIDVVRPSDPVLAQQLSTAREAALDASTQLIDDTVAALVRRMDADRLAGRLSADIWADLSARARALQPAMRGARRDDDVMLATLEAIEADRVAATRETVTAYRNSLDLAAMGPEAAERILARIDAGDLTTAAEYVQTLADGQALPSTSDRVDHLKRFAAFPPVFAKRPPAGGNPLLNTLRTLLETGADPEPGPLADALTAADIDLAALPRPDTVAKRLEQWTLLSEARSVNARIGNVKSLLEQVGFAVDKATLATGRVSGRAGRAGWLDLAGVRATVGNALLPAFGSAMSPAGNTLRLLAVWNSRSPAELIEMLRGEPADQSVIVLYFGTLDSAARRDLAALFRTGRKLPPTAVIDDAVFAYLACQPNPGRDVTMAITLPFTSSSPFTDVAGLVPQEMFYGRTEERDKVVDMTGPCLVYGGRQLGKTVLLVAAEREFDNGIDKRGTYLTIRQVGKTFPIEAVWTELWQELAKKEILPEHVPYGEVDTTLVGHVEAWIAARPGRQLLLLLDESDTFLDGDAEKGFPHVDRFKTLMESTGRRVKVAFAGLHQTARFERLANHPLAHFGDPVCVGPLAPQPAYNLLVNPLAALGYRFADDDLPARVLALTNNQPALIQLFGRQLLDNLRSGPLPKGAPPQPITSDDVERVWADPGLRGLFRKKFDLTLNLDPHYKVIAYAVALSAHSVGVDTAMTPTELRVDCEDWWPTGFAAEDIRTGEFRALLDECVDLGVLSRAGRGYRLRTPNVLDLLGSREDVEEFLERAESSLEPAEVFDAALMRPAYGDGPTRGPLASAQLADLLAVRNQVRLVTGSPALTVHRCLKALERENDRAVGDRRKAELRTATLSTLTTACAQACLKAAGRHAIVVVDLRDAPPTAATAAWLQARDLIAEQVTGTLGIVLISGPAQAAMWPDAVREAGASVGVTELRRYDNTDLRLALAETTVPFQDGASRAELLNVTGGWPRLVNDVFEELSRPRDGAATADPLASLRTRLADPGHAAELVNDAGAYADTVVAAAWEFLVELDEPADPGTLAGLLDDAAGEPGRESLADAALAAAGYRDRPAVVTVLRTLGLLTGAADGEGAFHVEPVIAAATRLAAR